MTRTDLTWKETTKGKHCRCWKCGGSGYIAAFAHIANGRCFACNGSGQLPWGQAVEDPKKYAKWTFQAGELVWQFEAISKDHWVLPMGDQAKAATFIFQCFKLGDSMRRGTTLLRARVKPEIARKVWAAAREGVKPEEMDNDFLGGFYNGYGERIGPWDENTCAMSRNKRGIEPLM